MGISDFRKIREIFIPESSLTALDQFVAKPVKVNVYVDGSFYIYLGCSTFNMNQDSKSYSSRKVAESAATIIYNNVCKIKKIRDVANVIVFFDGKRPRPKLKTSKKRIASKSIQLNVCESIYHLCKILNSHNYIIYNLTIGESEHEIVIHRDVSLPSIILTDDSDIFHIAYDYEDMTCNDYIFVCSKNLATTYDLYSLPKIMKMPKMLFSLLCILRGCDFTKSTFTTTMMMAIIQEYKNGSCSDLIRELEQRCKRFNVEEKEIAYTIRKSDSIVYNNIISEEVEMEQINGIYKADDVVFIMKLLLKMLLQSKMKFRWNVEDKQSLISCRKFNIQTHLDCIVWSLNYGLIGSRYVDYNKKLEPPNVVDFFLFYYWILTENLEGLIYNKTDDDDSFGILDVNYKLYIHKNLSNFNSLSFNIDPGKS